MNYLKKAAVCMTAAAMFAANSVGFMPYESIELPAITANAADIVASGVCGAEGDNVTWTLDSEGTLTISGEGEMDKLPSGSISTDIKNIVIEKGVINIGNSAFECFSNLTTITIPDSVTSIGKNAFSSCIELTSIAIPNSVISIGDGAFSYCKKLTTITIPDSVTSIGNSMFKNSSKLTTITIPDSVTSIGKEAFYNCSLTTITIPDSVTSIGDSAFDICDALTSITIENPECEISDSSSTISYETTIYGFIGSTAQAYAEKHNRKFVSIDEEADGKDEEADVKIVESGDCGVQGDNVTWQLDSAGTLTISGKGEIKAYSSYSPATWKSDNIYKVVIENGVTNIGNYAFSDCSSLKEIAIPDSVTSIGDYAFSECFSLKEIAIPDSVTSIGDDAFSECSSLKGIIIPDGVTSIGDDAFSRCVLLESITIPEGVTSIGYDAFRECSSLKGIIIPDGVTSIGDDAFSKCVLLESITIPDSVTSIGDDAFSGCSSLKGIIIPDGVTSIGSSVFSKCVLLESITIPDSVTSIGDDAFSGCSSLKGIIIPDGVTSIGYDAFSGCSSLKGITIPDGVTSIEKGVFSGCEALEIVIIPDSVTSISNSSFENTLWLEEKRAENPLVIVNDILIDGEDCKGDVIIPDGVICIVDDAFYCCSNITSVEIPDSVIDIGRWAFYNCYKLKSVKIPDSVTDIGSRAFYGTTWLEEKKAENPLVIVNDIVIDGTECTGDITIPEGITRIADDAFHGERYDEFPDITSVKLPDSLTIIGEKAFGSCRNLQLINIPNNVTSIGAEAFTSCNFQTINIPNSVTSIGAGAFLYCRNLTSISIPSSVLTIENNTFSSCENLTTLNIADGVKEIKGSPFSGCKKLTSLVIPNGVTSIERSTFSGLSGLKSVTLSESVEVIRPTPFDTSPNLAEIIIKNPELKIESSKSIPFKVTIYGYTGSTAQEFAEKYNRTFIALDESPETAPVTTAVTTATKAATTTTTTKAKPVTTTVKTTALYPLTKVVTTTNSIHVDYAPELEYDDSPMKVGETRAIYISDPTGKPVEDIKIMLMNDKISSSYEKGSNVLYITAVKPGKGSISLMIPGGSLTNGASFEIVEDTTVLTTTTVKATTVVTTTATTTAPTPDVILGDVDNNGIMDMSDASYIMAHYNAVACGQESPLNEAQQKAADTNGDGCINSYDAFIVSKIYAAIMTGMNVSDVPAYIAENFTYKCVDSADGGYTVEEIAASSVKPTLSVADVEYKLDELAENGYIAEVTLSAEGFDEDVTAFDFHVYYDEGLTPYYTENNGYKNLKVSTMGGAAYCSLGKGFNEADNYIFISLVNRQKENLNGEMIKLYFNVTKDAQSGDKFKVYPEYTKGDVLVSGADNKSHAYLFTQGLKGGTLSIKGDAVTTTVTTTKATTTTTTTATTTIPTTTEPVTTALGVVSTNCKITIDTLPTKTIYNVGEELDLDGGKISIFADVTFTDGENVHGERIDADMSRKNHIHVKHPTGSYIVPFVIKADTSAVDMSVPGEYPVIVKILDATENIVYTSETFNITVKEADTTTSTTTTTTTTTTVTTTITATKSTTTTAATTTTAPTTTTPPTTTEPTYTLGDVNEDGKVDSVDASLVLAEYALIQTGGDLTFTEKQKNAADVNKDGKTDSSDASKILEYYAAISTGKDPSWD